MGWQNSVLRPSLVSASQAAQETRQRIGDINAALVAQNHAVQQITRDMQHIAGQIHAFGESPAQNGQTQTLAVFDKAGQEFGTRGFVHAALLQP